MSYRACTDKKPVLSMILLYLIIQKRAPRACTRDGCPLGRGTRVKHIADYTACSLCSCAAGESPPQYDTSADPDMARCHHTLLPLPLKLAPAACCLQVRHLPLAVRLETVRLSHIRAAIGPLTLIGLAFALITVHALP